MRSVIHIPQRSRHSSSNISNIVGPSPTSSPRGRSRLHRPSDIGCSTRPTPIRSSSRHLSNRPSNSGPDSPRLSDGASARNCLRLDSCSPQTHTQPTQHPFLSLRQESKTFPTPLGLSTTHHSPSPSFPSTSGFTAPCPQQRR